MHRALAILVWTTLAFGLAGCGTAHRTPIWGYRVIDDKTIEVRVGGGSGTDTRVSSVTETSTTVVIVVESRPKEGGGGLVAQDVWLRVGLAAPLGSRTVIDADGNTPVAAEPMSSASSP